MDGKNDFQLTCFQKLRREVQFLQQGSFTAIALWTTFFKGLGIDFDKFVFF